MCSANDKYSHGLNKPWSVTQCAAVFTERSLGCNSSPLTLFSEHRAPTPMHYSTTVIKVTIFRVLVLPRLDLEVSNLVVVGFAE